MDCDVDQPPILDTITAYSDAFLTQYHCFEDLFPLVKRLPDDKAIDFLSHITETKPFTLDAFREKLKVRRPFIEFLCLSLIS